MLDQTQTNAARNPDTLPTTQRLTLLNPRVVLLPGDGIGPEVASAARSVVTSVCPDINWTVAEAGAAVMERGLASGLPAETLGAVESASAVLKGPLATPIGHGGKSANVTLRKMFELYANIRPVKALPGLEGPFAGREIDFTVVRENVEDLYAGIEHMQTPDVAQCLKIITRMGSEKIARTAFATAASERRASVHTVTKANIMKLTEGLFKSVAEEVAEDWPGIAHHHMLVDNCAQQMVLDPEQFDLIVTTNMNGDILSDLAAGLIGGLGLAPGANVGNDLGIFEAVHGSAPDIAGKGMANPTALILSAAMMLRQIGRPEAASRVEAAVKATYAEGLYLTPDVARKKAAVSTSAFTDRVIEHLSSTSNIIELPGAERMAVAPVELARPAQDVERSYAGFDLFVEWNGTVEDLASLLIEPARLAGYELELISNRGTKVWPNGGDLTDTVGHWRCRLVGGQEYRIRNVLGLLPGELRWMHIEKLERHDDVPAYSRAQGET